MENRNRENRVIATTPEEKGDNRSAIAVSRMDINKSYKEVSPLLTRLIQASDNHAWQQIKSKIDYIYTNLDITLSLLDREAGFLSQIKALLEGGRKLHFKPNLVSIELINPHTLGPLPGSCATTEWTFVAAVMRWFHDKGRISFYKMSIGDGPSTSPTLAARYTRIKKEGRPVTYEALVEGRSDDFYGGWGFYFVRKYLSESADSTMGDDPMRGLEESMANIYLAPGDAGDRLMVYDLNRISEDVSRGREVSIPGGQNAQSIILHKVIVGGDPKDEEDRSKYPGSVLVNLPKLKVHSQSLFTNAIKNLGLGLYPMLSSRTSDHRWSYAYPHNPVPGLKIMLPHQVWHPDLDLESYLPKRDAKDTYIVNKTGGLTHTILDVLRALDNESIFVVNIVDAIEVVNRDHQGIGLGVAEPEGLAIASTDILAIDLFCARYMFSNVGTEQAEAASLRDRFGGLFPQEVRLPRFDGEQIVTETGYDCPLSRDELFVQAEKAGLGKTDYYVVGRDDLTGNPLTDSKGRLGYTEGGAFHEIVTQTLFYDVYKVPWDLQATFFRYLEATDQLEKTSHKQDFLDAFDEDDDGVVTYEDYGKKGLFGPNLFLVGLYISKWGAADESEFFRTYYAMMSMQLRCAKPEWNGDGHDLGKEAFYGNAAGVAYMMSQHPKRHPDPYVPGIFWGQGNWPSFTLAISTYVHQVLYGWKFPKKVGLFSLYGSALGFADHKMNGRKFVGNLRGIPDPSGAQKYVESIRDKQTNPMDFTLFVPPGYGANGMLPNVQETSDPKKAFTAVFEQSRYIWPDVSEGQI